jgi:AcrR family transcriptional regulator
MQSRYWSPLRDARTAETRRRILTAAGELFATSGFVGATVPAIAARAGVSQPTVYAGFGSKAGIMRALLTQLEEDAGAPAWWARIEAAPDARQRLHEFAGWSRALFSTGRALIAAALGASGEPTVRELTGQGDRNRRAWLQPVVVSLAGEGALRPGLTEEQALDEAWMLTAPALYLDATEGCGWSDDAYERWLAGVLQDRLLRSG